MATIPDEVLFRYQVVSQVLALRRSGSSATGAVRAVARLEPVAWTGRPRRLSERTLWRWLRAFSQGGIVALGPEASRRVEGSLVLSQDFLDFLEQEKRDDPATSVPELIRRARENGLLEDADSVDRTTV